MPAKAAIRSRP